MPISSSQRRRCGLFAELDGGGVVIDHPHIG
jgi:hypothetical protein